jgi:hypothetical protein
MRKWFSSAVFVFTVWSAVILNSQVVEAYPHFIGHGYPSCLNCHYNPLGNGPLTDYGRSVGADLISSGVFYPKSWSEEKIAGLSGFLFRPPVQSHVRTQLNYRGLYFIQNPGTPTELKRYINMQGDAQLILKFGENDKLTFVGDFGYSPRPNRPPAGIDPNEKFRSREYYVGYRPRPEFGIYAGFMDKAYGIRIVEHIAYSRTIPQLTMNDQTHGIMGHVLTQDWEGAVTAFVGNLNVASDIRTKGVSGTVEHSLNEIHRVGISAMTSKNNYLNYTSYAAHARFNLRDGSALLFEFGQTQRTTMNNSDNRIIRYGLLQTYVRPIRGLYLIANIEYQKNNLVIDDTTLRWGPGVQYFPIQKLELRLDAYDTRDFNPSSSSQDTWMLLFQTHVWL